MHKRQFFTVFGLALLLSNGPSLPRAHALELFGLCLIKPCLSEGENDAINFTDPKRYGLTFSVIGSNIGSGLDEKRAKKLEDAVKSASDLWQGRDAAVGGSAGLITRAKGDYQRILAALYNEGHYGATISILVEGAEASGIQTGQSLSDMTSVAVAVDTGPLYRFGRTEIIGQAPSPINKDDDVPAYADIGFAAGLPAEAGAVGKALKLTRDAWREQGYAKAKITDQTVTADHPAQILNVSLTVEPGPVVRYGAVSVEGTERMVPDFVARQTGLIEGAIYDPDDVAAARKRLDRLGVFSSQKLQEADGLGADGSMPLTLSVSERKLRRFGFGATLSNVDGAGLESFWLHRNLFGRAERLRLEGGIGGVGSTVDYQKWDYNAGVTLTKPGFITPDTDLNFALNAKRDVTDDLTETSGGGALSLTQFYSEQLTLDGGIFAEYGQFEDNRGTREFIVAGLDLSARYDTRDDALNAAKGYYLTAAAKPFYEFKNQNVGLRMEGEARAYLALNGNESAVLAGRVALGSIVGVPRDQTPDNLLFFAGGGGSVRGYGYRSIGVTEPDGTVTGGRSTIEASAELRYQVTERFGAVAFADGGLVSASAVPNFNDTFRIGVGAGIRYFTGLGPIRVDVAVPLNRQAGDASFGFYAGIGQAF